MFGLYITHPQVRIDPDIPMQRWGLSEQGRERAKAAASMPWAAKLGRIVSSAETKAIQTASILAEAGGLSIEIVREAGENDRSSTGFLPPDDFEGAADAFFARPTESFKGWERAADAQSRIVEVATAILDRHDPQTPIAFVGHGAVGTLLKCHFAGRPVSRDEDQPAGGGNLFSFRLADRAVTCDWTAMERFQTA